MIIIKDLVEQLEKLTVAADHYYKWSNSFDLKIDCFKLKQEINNAKEVINRYHTSNNAE